jgi:N5-(cytidine 5'-diphosphoramidyl)-L-glutamine hydrolase
MRIAITMRVVENVGYQEWRDALSHDWIAFLVGLGAEPVLVPNLLPEPERFLDAMAPAGLILIGGDDPDPGIADMASAGRPQSGSPRLQRDWTEARLLAQARRQRLKVLGVCRGLETINLFFGGSVRPDIKGLTGENHVGECHKIRLSAPWLGRQAGATMQVNSFHRQGIRGDDLAPGLDSLATTECGVIEGLVHRELPIAAVQWHPERPHSDVEFDRRLFSECLGLGA